MQKIYFLVLVSFYASLLQAQPAIPVSGKVKA